MKAPAPNGAGIRTSGEIEIDSVLAWEQMMSSIPISPIHDTCIQKPRFGTAPARMGADPSNSDSRR